MTRQRLHALRRDRSGAVALEFALVAPIFIALLLGTIEFGRLLWTWQALQETASAGARCMALAQGSNPAGPCASGTAQSYVEGIANQWGISLASLPTTSPSSCPTSPTTPGICLSTNTTCGGTWGFSEVQIAETFISVAPLAFFFPSGGVMLTASACYPQNS